MLGGFRIKNRFFGLEYGVGVLGVFVGVSFYKGRVSEGVAFFFRFLGYVWERS